MTNENKIVIINIQFILLYFYAFRNHNDIANTFNRTITH